jgi:hypothetical protein
LLAITGAASAQAAECPVSDSAGLATKLADSGCSLITVAPGTYVGGFSVSRTVTIAGAGAAQTTLVGPGANVITITAGDVSLSGVTISGTALHSGIANTGPTSTVTVSNSVITGNGDSGIRSSSNATPSVTVTDSVISDNFASAGGGVSVTGAPATLNFNRVLFTGNNAINNGGAISNGVSAATVTLTNVTLTDNHAASNGGALYNNGPGAQFDLNNVTVAGNVADDDMNGTGDGGGIALTGVLSVRNSIIANNIDRGGVTVANDCAGNGTFGLTTRLGYELVRDPSGCAFDTSGGTDTAVGYLTGIDPLLGSLAPGAATALPPASLPLLAGSPAIGAGNPAAPGSGGAACDAVDQRGLPRGGNNGVCDIGAFELQVPPPPSPSVPAAMKKKCKKGFKLVKKHGKKKCKKKK